MIEGYALENLLITVLLTGTITLVIVLLLMLIRKKTKVNEEVFRKLMHFTAIAMTPLCLYFAIDFYIAAFSLFIFAIGANIGLRLISKVKGYTDFFVERTDGEIRKSFIQYCCLQACIIIVCGVYGDIGVVYIELLVWALGDAAAALIGKKLGKKHFRIANNDKTYAGSIAMFIVAFAVSIIAMFVLYDYSVLRVLLQSLVIAVVATFVELVSKGSIDTVTIPVSVTLICMISSNIC